MRISLFWRVMPAYIFVMALFALPLWQRHSAEVKAQQALAVLQEELPLEKTNKYIEGTPTRIIVPRLGIDLQVVFGVYDANANAWTVSDNKANYAFNTVKNNTEDGTTLIYGHWTRDVFGATDNIKPEDKVIIITDNGHKFGYVYKSDEILNPTDTQLFKELQGNKPRLALMTCQGLWSQERRVMYFDLESVK